MARVALAALAIAATARAAIVYSWTDANGTVHFGDAPPPHGSQVKTEYLPDVRMPAAPAAGDQIGRAPAEADKTPQGPARVALTEQKAEAVSPEVQSFRGKVKNEGGAEAHDVAIDITVTEPTQGDECLHERMDVEPPALAPGAEGTFDARFESPCFQGPTQTDLRVEWR